MAIGVSIAGSKDDFMTPFSTIVNRIDIETSVVSLLSSGEARFSTTQNPRLKPDLTLKKSIRKLPLPDWVIWPP